MKIKYIFLVKTVVAMLTVMSITVYSDENPSTNILPNNLNVKDIKIDPHNANIIYAGIEKKGLYRSADKGETWVFCGSGIPDNIKVIAFDPVKKIIYVGASENLYTAENLYMSYDGNKWIYLAKFSSLYDIFIQPKYDPEPSIIYIRTGMGLYVSTDDERTWEKNNRKLLPGVLLTPEAADPSDPDIIYFTMSKSDDVGIFIINEMGISEAWNEMGIYKSNDHGETLEKISSIVPEILLISPNNKNLMYGTTGSEKVIMSGKTDSKLILKSTDGGVSWKEKDIYIESDSVVALVMDPVDDNVLYAATSVDRERRQDFSASRMFKSVDGGETWQKISEFPVKRIAIDPSNPNILYAGTPQMGIYKSTDAGKTWEAINNGIE